MAEAIAKLYAEIGADTSKLETGLRNTKTGLKDASLELSKFSGSTQAMADDVARAGVDLGDMKSKMSEWISRLQNATPQNMMFAQSFEKITRDFEDGKLTSKQAADQLLVLQQQMDKANISAKGTGITFEKLSTIVTGVQSAFMLAREGVEYVTKAYDATIGKAIALADQTEVLSRLTGDSAESTSRLIDTAKKLGVSYEDLAGVLEFRVRKNLSTNLDDIAALSDQYLKLPAGLEASNFLMDQFGRSSQNVAEFMELGSEKIKEYYKNVNNGLILTEAQIQQAKQLGIAQQTLTDQWDALTVQLGQKTIPTLIDLIGQGNAQITATLELIDILQNNGLIAAMKYEAANYDVLIGKSKEINDIYSDQGELAGNVVQVTGKNSEALRDYEKEAEKMPAIIDAATLSMVEHEDALLNVAEAYKESKSEAVALSVALAGTLEKENERFQSSLLDLETKLDDVNNQIYALSGKKTLTPEQENQLAKAWNLWNELNKKIKEGGDKSQTTKDAFAKVNNEIAILTGSEYLTEDQKKQLDDLENQQWDITQAIEAEQKAHEKATKQFLLDQLQKQLALDGFQQKDTDIVMAVAKNWGLISQADYDAYMKMKDVVDEEIRAGDEAEIAAQKITEAFDGIQINIPINYVIPNWTPPTGATGMPGPNIPVIPGSYGTSGGNPVSPPYVPGGMSNTSPTSSAGGDTYNVYATVNNDLDVTRLAQRIQEEKRRRA